MSTPKAIKKEEYYQLGYEDLDVGRRTGLATEFLVHRGLGRVVKLNEDEAYDVFVDEALDAKGYQIPVFYKHEVGLGVSPYSASRFSLVEMELLEALTDDESAVVDGWIADAFSRRSAEEDFSSIPDPLGLNATYGWLEEIASRKKLKLDMTKLDNYMVRVTGETRQIVVIDPFN